MTLTGTGFTTAGVVDFGTTAATSFEIVSDSVIAAQTPPATGTGQITVTTSGGTGKRHRIHRRHPTGI